MTWLWNKANSRWESGHWWIASNPPPRSCSILYWHESGASFATSMNEFETLAEAVAQAEKWEAEGYRPEPIVITVGMRAKEAT